MKVAFQGSRITSDAGLLLVRELDERLGLETLISEHLNDSRQGLNTQFSLADLLRQSDYSRLAGYEDLNDAVRVSADPTFRLIGSPKRWDRGGALTSTLHWFETELLTQEDNLAGLRAVNREVLAQAEMATPTDRIVLDMDSSESPVHGAQEGSAYNGVYPGFPTLFWGLSGFFVNDLMGKALWSSWKTRSVFQGAVGAFCASTAPSASTGPICMRQDRRVLGLQSTRE